MNCYHCKKSITKKPWNHLTNVYDNDIIEDKYICSYVCYKRLSENNKLPRDLWQHIVNKEDYEGLINPVLPRAKEFQYLTYEEISEMNEAEKENYFKQKSEQVEYDSKLTELREELELEDKRTSELEIGSGSDNDDY